MKDIFSAFGSDVLRPIASLFIPGVIATAPAVAALLWANAQLRNFLGSVRTEATVGAVLLALFMGLVCEDLGSHIEYWFDCKQNKACNKLGREREADEHGKNWYEYLRIAYRIEPVGHHYLRTLVMRLKFELGSLAAFALALIGIWWLPTTYSVRISTSVIPILFIALFYFEAQWTHQLLSDLRAELLKGIDEWPGQPTAKAASTST